MQNHQSESCFQNGSAGRFSQRNSWSGRLYREVPLEHHLSLLSLKAQSHVSELTPQHWVWAQYSSKETALLYTGTNNSSLAHPRKGHQAANSLLGSWMLCSDWRGWLVVPIPTPETERQSPVPQGPPKGILVLAASVLVTSASSQRLPGSLGQHFSLLTHSCAIRGIENKEQPMGSSLENLKGSHFWECRAPACYVIWVLVSSLLFLL